MAALSVSGLYTCLEVLKIGLILCITRLAVCEHCNGLDMKAVFISVIFIER